MRHLRLTHPSLDFWVDIRLREFDGRWLAVADLAGEQGGCLGAHGALGADFCPCNDERRVVLNLAIRYGK